MKKTIIVLGAVALIGIGNSAMADEPSTGHTTEVTPGDWDDDDPKINFNFQDIPQSKYSGLRLTLSCGLPEAQIFYTKDPKATPDNVEAWSVYTEPLYLTEDCTVRFFARCEGYNDSDIQAYTFVFADHQAIAPQIAPDMDKTRLMMTCETIGAAIRYTTDGSEPTPESTLYEGPVELTENCVFRARSFADDMFDSNISEYTVDFLTAGMPEAAFANRALVLTAADSKDSVYFTTNPDATPEDIEQWTLYTAPIALTEDCTVRYFGRRNGFNDSEIASFSFVFAAYQTSTPVLTADAAGTHVVMECDTEGAEIRYTKDGSEPTAQSTLYTEPVEIIGNGTFRARAFKEGLFDSNTVDFIVMHMAVPSPTAVFENKRLVLSCADEKAKIMYTFDTDATPDNTG
ncbi:MAG: chitobiase/beta-hexosaminidase C-terminal domain-containing protein, partial [Muribaculaceae bacterium]|nr:chitobiase/beta-hexosaminidase C-terminal domain-containing protein [Muribaculaceae bacterium]